MLNVSGLLLNQGQYFSYRGGAGLQFRLDPGIKGGTRDEQGWYVRVTKLQ
jgi:hypothetical protein